MSKDKDQQSSPPSFSNHLEHSLSKSPQTPFLDEDAPTEIDEVTEVETLNIEHTETWEEDDWGQLHPYSLLINLVPQMGRTIQNAWPIILFIIVGNNDAGQVIDSIFVLFFVALSVLRTFIHFLTLRYRIQDGKLIVKMGLIFRQARTLDPTRIQNIEITQNLLHKYFNLVELRVETAGDASTKGLLSALSRVDANRLKQSLQRSRQRHFSTEDRIPPQMKQTWGELLLFGFSKRTVGTVVVLSAIASEAMTVVNPQEAQAIASSLSLKLFFGLLALSFSASWIWSSMQSILRFHRLELRIHQDEIGIESGLITRRSVEIPREKIQIIEWFEPWLRRQMGFGSLYLDTAAFGIADGQIRRSEGVIPMVEANEMPSILAMIAPKTAQEILSAQTNPPHNYARLPISLGYLMPFFLVLGFVFWTSSPSPYLLSMITIIGLSIVIGLTELDFRKQMWALTSTAILSRSGYLTRRTWILDRDKIQNIFYEQGPLLQSLGLARVVIQVAGSAIELPLVTQNEAHNILNVLRQDWLTA